MAIRPKPVIPWIAGKNPTLAHKRAFLRACRRISKIHFYLDKHEQILLGKALDWNIYYCKCGHFWCRQVSEVKAPEPIWGLVGGDWYEYIMKLALNHSSECALAWQHYKSQVGRGRFVPHPASGEYGTKPANMY